MTINLSEKMIKKWKDKGWTMAEIENGIVFTISYQFKKDNRENLKTHFWIWFKLENNIPYYYTEAKIIDEISKSQVPVLFFVEPPEHVLITETLEDLGWLKNKKEEEKEYNLFNLED